MLCYSKNAVSEPNLVYIWFRKLLNDTDAKKWRQRQVISYEGYWVEVAG